MKEMNIATTVFVLILSLVMFIVAMLFSEQYPLAILVGILGVGGIFYSAFRLWQAVKEI